MTRKASNTMKGGCKEWSLLCQYDVQNEVRIGSMSLCNCCKLNTTKYSRWDSRRDLLRNFFFYFFDFTTCTCIHVGRRWLAEFFLRFTDVIQPPPLRSSPPSFPWYLYNYHSLSRSLTHIFLFSSQYMPMQLQPTFLNFHSSTKNFA